jgi:DNA-binding FadR family transcriptional regulator
LSAPAKSRPPLKALKRKQMLYQVVQDEVKAYIIEHNLKAGDPLPPETELAQQLNVSRNSVREAVKALEALGILEARHGTGLFVLDFSFDPILDNLAYGIMLDLKPLIDVLEVRFHLEYSMVDKVIQKKTPEQIQRLRGALDQLEAAAQQGFYSAEADRAFHRHLYDEINNHILWRILDIFWMVLRQAEDHAALPRPSDPVESHRVHVPILEALEAGDANAMRDAIRQHYQGVEARVMKHQEEQARRSEST